MSNLAEKLAVIYETERARFTACGGFAYPHLAAAQVGAMGKVLEELASTSPSDKMIDAGNVAQCSSRHCSCQSVKIYQAMISEIV